MKPEHYEINLCFSTNINIEIFESLINELYRIYQHNNFDEGIIWLMDVGMIFWLDSENTTYIWKQDKIGKL
jgi:hypothetical protein